LYHRDCTDQAASVHRLFLCNTHVHHYVTTTTTTTFVTTKIDWTRRTENGLYERTNVKRATCKTPTLKQDDDDNDNDNDHDAIRFYYFCHLFYICYIE
jgi:hypothetical protein